MGENDMLLAGVIILATIIAAFGALVYGLCELDTYREAHRDDY